MEEPSTSLPAAHIGVGSEDVIEDPVDTIGVWAIGVAVDLHEEKDGPFVLMVCSGIPGPGCEFRVGFEGDGALAYREAGFDEAAGP